MMPFDWLHRASTIATLLAGLAILALSGEFSWAILAPAVLAVVAGPWVRTLLDRPIANKVMTFAAVFAGFGAALLAFYTENYFYYTILYAIFLAVARSLMLHRAQDFMQVYALSFLHVMSGAVIHSGPSFGVVLFPYIIFLTLSLLLTNVRRGVEDDAASHPIGHHGDSTPIWLQRRDLLPGGFLLLTVGLTSLIFIVSVVFFFLFPRVGLGFFAHQARHGVAMSGFSDTVQLGDFGHIVDDPEVVARVRFLDGPPVVPLRLRGQSLDTYDGRTWFKTTKRLWELRVDAKGRHVLDPSGPDPDSPGVRSAEIYLEPLGGSRRVLFSPPFPVAFRRPPNALEALRPERWRFGRDIAGDVFVSGPPATSIQYTVFWKENEPDPEALRSTSHEIPEWVHRRYLQVPELAPAVLDLARQITLRADNPFDMARAIETHLRTNYEYAVDTRHGDEDPLADFLLRHRQGHCEYFASAMVILLRAVGVPARMVTGFYGGEVNEYGGYVAIRKADAHAWVEVFFPGHGFVLFDPTPPIAFEERSGDGFWSDVRAALDAVRLWWYSWVVEYNLDKQMDIVVSLLRPAGREGMTGFHWRDFREFKQRIRNAPWGRWGAMALGMTLGLVALVLILRWVVARRAPRTGDSSNPAVQAWLRLKNTARSVGMKREPTETPLDFARRMSEALPSAASAIEEVTWAYLRARFAPGSRLPGPGDLDPALAAIERAASRESHRRQKPIRE